MRPIWSTCSARQGSTLIEMMVAAALAVLGFMMLLGLLTRTSAVMNRTLVVSQLQQNCEVTVNRLTNFAARCDVGGVGFCQDPALTGLALHPVQDVLGNGYKHYDPYVTLFSWTPTNNTLVEIHSLDLAPEERWQPTKLNPDAIGILSLVTPKRILSQMVTRMELYTPDENCPLLLKIDFQNNAAGYGIQRVHVDRYLNVRDVL